MDVHTAAGSSYVVLVGGWMDGVEGYAICFYSSLYMSFGGVMRQQHHPSSLRKKQNKLLRKCKCGAPPPHQLSSFSFTQTKGKVFFWLATSKLIVYLENVKLLSGDTKTVLAF